MVKKGRFLSIMNEGGSILYVREMDLTGDCRQSRPAYPNAGKVDLVGGGPLDDGRAFGYAGEATMAKEVQLGKQYGGIMIWELMGDAPAPHSLWDVIQKNF